MKNHTHSEFFNVLVRNDEKEIREYLARNGKLPKPICPIMFIKKEENSEQEK